MKRIAYTSDFKRTWQGSRCLSVCYLARRNGNGSSGLASASQKEGNNGQWMYSHYTLCSFNFFKASPSRLRINKASTMWRLFSLPRAGTADSAAPDEGREGSPATAASLCFSYLRLLSPSFIAGPNVFLAARCAAYGPREYFLTKGKLFKRRPCLGSLRLPNTHRVITLFRPAYQWIYRWTRTPKLGDLLILTSDVFLGSGR